MNGTIRHHRNRRTEVINHTHKHSCRCHLTVRCLVHVQFFIIFFFFVKTHSIFNISKVNLCSTVLFYDSGGWPGGNNHNAQKTNDDGWDDDPKPTNNRNTNNGKYLFSNFVFDFCLQTVLLSNHIGRYKRFQ